MKIKEVLDKNLTTKKKAIKEKKQKIKLPKTMMIQMENQSWEIKRFLTELWSLNVFGG